MSVSVMIGRLTKQGLRVIQFMDVYIFFALVSDICGYKKSLIFGCTTIHSIKDSRNKNCHQYQVRILMTYN